MHSWWGNIVLHLALYLALFVPSGYALSKKAFRIMKSRGEKRRGDEASEEVRWSKKLSWALRHHAVDLGLSINSAGFVPVDELLGKRDFSCLSFDMLQRIVDNNAKKRFELVSTSATADLSVPLSPSTSMIRAVQGHSIKVVEDDELLTPILSLEDLRAQTSSGVLVHGTYRRHLDGIRREGLKSLSRNHIHLAIHLPRRHAHLLAAEGSAERESKEAADAEGDGVGEVEIVSGLRGNCEIAIVIDVARALAEGVKFFLAKNRVVLTRGWDEQGVLPPRFFRQILALDGKPLD